MGFDFYPFLILYLTGAYLLLLQLLRLKPLNCLFFLSDLQFRRHLTNATIVLTGATGGIGAELKRLLEQRGARVLCLVPPDRVDENDEDAIACDLRSASSIRMAANAVRNRIKQGAVLVHAAGLLGGAPDDVYCVNLIGPALLTHLVGDAAQYVVFLGSAAHIASPTLKTPLLIPPSANPSHAVYPASKLLVHALAVHLANKTDYDGVHVIHPGIVATTLYRAETGVIGRVLRNFLRFVAWDATTSATRVLYMLHTAGVFEGSRCTNAMYWDARTLDPHVLRCPHSKQLGAELECTIRRSREAE